MDELEDQEPARWLSTHSLRHPSATDVLRSGRTSVMSSTPSARPSSPREVYLSVVHDLRQAVSDQPLLTITSEHLGMSALCLSAELRNARIAARRRVRFPATGP